MSLPPSTHPGTVTLQVAHLDRSLDWYRRVLGLRPADRSGSRAVLAPAGDGTPLVILHEHPGAAPVPPRGRLGLFHYAILLPDRAALGRFVAHASALRVPMGASDHLVSEALYLHDPDGLGIEVYADRPRSMWRTRDGQLVMATEPLDVPDLLRAAGGEPWTGMPAGTVIGHMHLHVGDLARAEAFYHRDLGLDRTVWSYPGALFLAAGGYHHHLGLNTWAAGAAPPAADDARLLEWELVLPSDDQARRVLDGMATAGHAVEPARDGGVVRDPWGTALRIRGDVAPP